MVLKSDHSSIKIFTVNQFGITVKFYMVSYSWLAIHV